MGKRSDFERVERDFYPTPLSAVLPLLPHLAPRSRFIEPCAGNGALADHLTSFGHICEAAYDIEPLAPDIIRKNAMDLRAPGALFITNPPWDRTVLHPLIRHLASMGPTWLLFDADWLHNVKSGAFEPMLRKVVSVGRVKWIAGSESTGMDNAAWYLFGAPVEGNEPTIRLRRPAADPGQVTLTFGSEE